MIALPITRIACLTPWITLALAQAAPPDATLAIVDSHRISFTAPARRIPSQTMVDGPLLGNGDVGVVVAGSPDQLRFHVGKNDFWGIRTQAPMAVGRIELTVPELVGATYQAECDLRRAHWQGNFARETAALSTRAWVDARANRVFVELDNRGKSPLTVNVAQIMGAGPTQSVPPQVDGNSNPVLSGCEQHGRRWFFDGEIAGLEVIPASLTDNEIAKKTASPRGSTQVLDGKTAVPITAPTITRDLTLAAWIKIRDFDRKEANYIISKGDWNQAFSLGLSGGRLRFAINGTFIQSDAVLPVDKWVHVAAAFSGGKRLAIWVDGKLAKELAIESSGGLSFVYDPDAGRPGARKLAMVTRILGTDAGASQIRLAPGARAVIASAILTDLDDPAPLAGAQKEVAALTAEKVGALATEHQSWWRDFWSRSMIEIPDKVIEQHWYSTQYIMASCSRAGKVAPGLWGNWITRDDTYWHGDYHLNYNFQAPFYSVFSANHPEVALPFFDAMNQSVPRGQRIAAQRGWKGIHLPVSIGPWGMCPEGDDCDWGQRSNTAYAALPFIWYYQATQDTTWLKAVGYPYLREVEKFWTDYLKLENGRYVIENDAIHEGSGGAGRSGKSADFNPILTLGLVRALYQNILPMSEDLGVDAELRPKWRDILARMSGFPTQERNGKTVFRYTERGTPWWNGNTLGIQHIFPSGAIGLDSDPKLLEISHNMLDAMGRWADYNGSSSWYTACARVGYQPEKILTEMRRMYDRHSMPSKILYFGGGGIENASSSLAINEMLLQSHEGVIRFFPCWPKNLDARFGTLRAAGAFLVSAELKGGVVGKVRITSEKGRHCVIANPWPDKNVQVVRNGKTAGTMNGPRFTLQSASGETIELNPL